MARLRSPILWILVLGALLRFIQIDSPPVGRHAWRQSDTASVARNYHRTGHRFLYPQIDWEMPGYAEMEFPLYPWTASLVYRVAGETEVVPRALSVVASLVTLAVLYLLVGHILSRRAALWAACFWAVLPLSLFFDRAIMPEAWMMAATVVSVYAFLRWTETESKSFFVLAALATALACLLKLTSLYLGLPHLWLAWQRWGRRGLGDWRIWLFGTLVTVPLLLWYGHAFDLGQTYGASFNILTAAGTDKWGNWLLLLDPAFYHRVFVGNLGGRMLTWTGFLVFLSGLILPRHSKGERLFDVWLLAVVIVLLLAAGGSFQHDYYSLPILLPAVAFMGKAFDRGWERHRTFLLVTAASIVVLSGYRFLGTLAEERIQGLDQEVARLVAAETSDGDRVISCHGANPVWLYLADRRGFGRDCSQLGKAELDTLISRGAKLLVGLRGEGFTGDSGRGLVGHLESFYEVPDNDSEVFLARLGDARRFEDLSRETWFEEDFAGRRARRSTFHSTPIPCGVCRFEIDLDWPAKGRGRRRAIKESIWIGNSASGDGFRITLDPRRDRVRFQQKRGGQSLGTTLVEHPIDVGRPHQLEVRYDYLEFELLLDGTSILHEPSHLPAFRGDELRIQSRSGTTGVRKIAMQVAFPDDHL